MTIWWYNYAERQLNQVKKNDYQIISPCATKGKTSRFLTKNKLKN